MGNKFKARQPGRKEVYSTIQDLILDLREPSTDLAWRQSLIEFEELLSRDFDVISKSVYMWKRYDEYWRVYLYLIGIARNKETTDTEGCSEVLRIPLEKVEEVWNDLRRDGLLEESFSPTGEIVETVVMFVQTLPNSRAWEDPEVVKACNNLQKRQTRGRGVMMNELLEIARETC